MSEIIMEPSLFFDVVDRLADLYVSYRGKCVVMGPDGSIFIPKRRVGDSLAPARLTNSLLCAHVNQRLAVSVYAGKYSAKFICFDVDDGNPETVRTIVDLCVEGGIPREKVYVSTSGGKGFHVEIFFDELVYVNRMERFYDWVCFKGGLDRAKVEYRPSGTHAIKLPLSRNFRTGNICWFLDQDTLEPVKDPTYVLDVQKFPASLFTVIADTLYGEMIASGVTPISPAAKSVAAPAIDEVETKLSFGDTLPDLTSEGMTHKTILAIACRLRCKGREPQQIEDDLMEWYSRQNPAYITDPESEVIRDIRKCTEWVFSDKFQPFVGKKSGIIFSPEDVDLLLGQKRKTDRRVAFAIMYLSKRFGTAKISYRKLSSLCGLCEKTVITAIASLREQGVVGYRTGKARLSNGFYSRDFNTYWIAMQKKKPPKLCSGDAVSLVTDLTEDSFDEVYYSLLARMADQPTLRKILTRSELKRLEEIKNEEV